MIKKMFNITDNPSTPPRIAGVTTGYYNIISKSQEVYKLKSLPKQVWHRCLSSVAFDLYKLDMKINIYYMHNIIVVIK